MTGDFGKAYKHKVIYVFEIKDEAHKGLVKIGDATLQTDKAIDQLPPNSHDLNQAAKDRIKSYTNTAGIVTNLLHTELAVKAITDKNGKQILKAFRDHDVHRVLENSNIHKVAIEGTTGQEWYPVDVITARKAIDAVKSGINNLSAQDITTFVPIIFRPEQEAAIKQTVKQFKKGSRMLWNAKMRFGKTVCALEVARRMNFDHTIIITHRPVVNEGWYEDFGKIFHGVNCIYGSKANGYSIDELLRMQDKQFIYFASIQDLRGSSLVGGKFEKNSKVFDLDWDFVIVDEAHEGTTTALGDDVIKNIVKQDSDHDTKFLALSGTPFNILTDYGEEEVYTWDYIMEQESKANWGLEHFGDSNPYDELPELKIYTYDLGKLTDNKFMALEDRAFNFHEFFRTWTGDIGKDYDPVPNGAKVGDFVHEADVYNFLNLMTMEDEDSFYPYSREEYRKLFTHSLWMLPGVKEARALKKLMMKHPVFGSGAFNIVNVAGAGDEEESYTSALTKVQKAISTTLPGHYTITLSCGKLTTGVTVREWTAVFMLAGTFSTSAANYLQTIFRVQSPCNKDGMIKETGYVFDFAPDRTLKMIADAVSVSHKAGKSGDTVALGKFLNFCPVISVQGSEMRQYNTNQLLQQLKRAYADRVVRSGFDDTNLYNDELLKLTDLEIKKFDELKGIIGKTKAAPKANDIKVNEQGLTQEEYEEIERLKKKKKKELSPEEKARLEELKKMKKLRNDAISILRGISIRMPLLIYGADIPFNDEVTINNFAELVDDASWEEFMPAGVTKERFNDFKKYYDPDVFVAAGRRIRSIAKSADELEPTERVKKIAGLFSYFKNPDKETVLTPWRVVNMHMSDCLGGYDFWDDKHEDPLDEPRFVDRGKVTKDVFENEDTHILEINSKTGLYPLYVTYSVYREQCKKSIEKEISFKNRMKIWDEVIKNNVFVICKTKMAKSITNRTLVGYRSAISANTKFTVGLINTMKNEGPKFVKRTRRASYWNKEGDVMKFDAIIGNPPYQETTAGGTDSGKSAKQAKPIFHLFASQAKALKPHYASMIIPARWYNGGIGLNAFRQEMLSDKHLEKLFDYNNSKDCFPTVDIAGGLCYYLWNSDYYGDCEIVNVVAGERDSLSRPLDQFEDFFVRANNSIPIINKVKSKTNEFMRDMVSSIDTFGIPSKEKGHEVKKEGDIELLHTVGFNDQGTSYISREKVKKNKDLIDKYKVKISIMVPQGGEVGIKPKNGYRSISTPQVLPPGQVDSFSYLNIGFFDTKEEADNLVKYISCKFPRFLLRTTFSSVHISRDNFVFVPKMDFTKQWTDDELYDYFELSDDEKILIEKTMRPMR